MRQKLRTRSPAATDKTTAQAISEVTRRENDLRCALPEVVRPLRRLEVTFTSESERAGSQAKKSVTAQTAASVTATAVPFKCKSRMRGRCSTETWVTALTAIRAASRPRTQPAA